MHKFQILLCHYNRPNMVQWALDSVRKQTYTGWELAIVDDSPQPLLREKIVPDIFKGYDNKITIYEPMDSDERKSQQGGSRLGHFWNVAMKESDADIGIMLCDDDGLVCDYLEGLNQFFTENPNLMYAFSNVIPWDPYKQEMYSVMPSPCGLNHGNPINPVCRVDASQVAWKLDCCKEGNCWFPEIQTRNLDAHLYSFLYRTYGNCHPTGLYGQYKGLYETNLHRRRNDFGDNIDLSNPPKLYDTTI